MIPFHGSQYPFSGKKPGKSGHYESWFVRANHPQKPQAFWIRYTLFIPADNRPSLGELWAVWFDGDKKQVTAVKEEYPLDTCTFSTQKMDVRIGQSTLSDNHLQGSARYKGHTMEWLLDYQGKASPLLFLPERFYKTSLPKAKSLVSRPLQAFNGTLIIDGEHITIDNWAGSENHNWGKQHTDQYAWGQVSGFDNAPDAFLECITARVKIGPVHSPWLSIACLRIGDDEYAFNQLSQAYRSQGRYRFFDWQLETRNADSKLSVSIKAEPHHFTALTYYNPSTDSKTCLNSKIATCSLLLERNGKPTMVLNSHHGAAFEILTDCNRHAIPLAV